jgi:Tol biopolymer transport system component/DNA-binding winged helix-turn-helix (wHTH) protein
MTGNGKQIYKFGPFVLDSGERRFSRGGEVVPLKPKSFDLLLTLVQSAGSLITKDELLEKVWGGAAVEESNITVHVSALRKALGKASEADAGFIENVPKYGYRFTAEVREILENGGAVVDPGPATHGVIENQQSNALNAPPAVMRTPLPAWRVNRKRIGLIAGVVVIGTMIAAAIFNWRSPPASKRAQSLFLQTRMARLTTSGNNRYAVISPDGKYVAYVVRANGKQSLWVRVVANSSDLQILPPENTIYESMAISPDSQTLYFGKTTNFGSDSGIYQVPVLGGVQKKLVNGSFTSVSFSPDGKRFAFVGWNADQGSDDVCLANADGTEAHRLAVHKLEGPGDTCSPAWSPDGKLIVCAWGTEADNSMNLFGIRVGDGTISPLLDKKWDEIGETVWLPDGSGLFITARERGSELFQIWLVRYPTGEVRRLTNDTDNYRFISLTSDSATVAAVRTDRQSNIWVAPAGNTGNAKQITFTNYDADNDQGLSWTPKGQIVYATKASGKSEIWIVDEDGRNQRQLTDDSSSNYMPAVTPDGRYIIFASTRGGGMPHLWKMDVDGGNPRQLTNGPIEILPQVSPDGKWIVYHSYASGVTTVWRMPIDGGEPMLLTDKVLDGYSSVSPDGKFVSCLYLDDSDGKKYWKIAMVPFDGGRPVKLFDVRPSPISFSPLFWTSDGNSLMYLDRKNGVSNIMQLSIESGDSRQMTNFTSDRIFYFDWSRDGKRLAIARGRVNEDVVLISDLEHAPRN